MPAISRTYVKGPSGIVVPVEYEFIPGKRSDGKSSSKWANKEHWIEIKEMVKEATEDAIETEKFCLIPTNKIIERATTAMGYNLKINDKFRDLGDSIVRYWSDDEDDDDGDRTISKYYVSACILQRSSNGDLDDNVIASYIDINVDDTSHQVFRPYESSAIETIYVDAPSAPSGSDLGWKDMPKKAIMKSWINK